MTAPASTTDPTVGAATKIARRPGQRWEYGPVSFAGERKAYVTELSTYLGWVSQVETKFNDPAAAAQRIRMMYYGGAAGSLSLFDKLISSSSRWASAPLTTGDVPQDTLDGLMATGWVSVGANQDRRRFVDISHVWVLLDAALNGLGVLGDLVDVVTPTLGLMSWTGDLASWWTEYNDQKQCYIKNLPAGQTLTEDPSNLTVPTRWLNSGQAARCAIDDVLGDMDAMALAAVGAPMVEAGSKSLTALLTQYYTASSNTTPADKTFLHSDNRFHLFVRHCAPAIPFDDAGSGAAALNANSGPAVRALLTTAVHVLLLNARGISPRFMWGALEFPALSGLTGYLIERSVENEIGSPWGTAMINQVADTFTAFLSAGLAGTGWTSATWPTAGFAIDSARRGGFALQMGDSDDSGTYGGTTQTAASYVANLQDDLKTLGFTGVGTSDGGFGAKTATTLREFQIEASQPSIYAQSDQGIAGHPLVNVVLPVIRRYRGPVNGVATVETCEALAHWLAPYQAPRHCLAPPGPAQGLLQILNPVSISSRSGVDASDDGTINTSDMWFYGETGNSAAHDPRVYAVDQLQRYAIPPAEVVGTDPGLTCIGHWATTSFGNGPVLQQTDWWNSALVSLGNLVPPSLDHTSPAVLSQYRVVRAVAEVEDIGHYDVYNAWDSAILSFGLLHWALQSTGVGELGAFLSFYQSIDPAGYDADFGSKGIQPGSAWDPSTLDPDLLTYDNSLEMYGLHDAGGTLQPGQLLTLKIKSAADGYLGNYMRSWRSLHRVAMTLRTRMSLRSAMWYFATQRVRNLLTAPWPGGSAVNCPVVTVGGVQNLATIGQVFTSEQAVAGLLRWHVNQPATLLLVTKYFNPSAIQQAFTDPSAYGTGIVDVSAITEPAKTQKQQGLVNSLLALAANAVAGASLQQTMTTAINHADPDAGSLSAAAGSYRG